MKFVDIFLLNTWKECRRFSLPKQAPQAVLQCRLSAAVIGWPLYDQISVLVTLPLLIDCSLSAFTHKDPPFS